VKLPIKIPNPATSVTCLILLIIFMSIFSGCRDETKITANSPDQLKANKSADSLVNLGIACFGRKLDSSYFYFSEALKIAGKYELKDQEHAILLQLSNVYYAAHDFQMTVILLDSVIKLTTLDGNYEVLSNALNNLGNVKYDLHDHNDARRLYDSAFEVARKHRLFRQMGVAMGSLARYEEDNELSLKMHEQAIGFLKKSPENEEAIARLMINIGNRSTNPDSAIKYYYAAIRMVDRKNSSEVTMMAYNLHYSQTQISTKN
jgi:tetratricopeptide (TPR) repeat protein